MNKLNATKISRLQSGVGPLVELLVEGVRASYRAQAKEQHVTDQRREGGRSQSEKPEQKVLAAASLHARGVGSKHPHSAICVVPFIEEPDEVRQGQVGRHRRENHLRGE
jgi:hypothetical protein